MTSRPPQTLSQDASVDYNRNKHASDAIPLLNSTDLSNLGSVSTVGDFNRRNVHSSQSLPLTCANGHNGHDDSHTKSPDTSGDTMSPQPPSRPAHPQFRTHTIVPSISDIATSDLASVAENENPHDPLGASDETSRKSLHITTEFRPAPPNRNRSESGGSNNGTYGQNGLAPSGGYHPHRKASVSSLKPIQRTPSVNQAITHNIGSANSSAVPSPLITAMGDLTPLPSPLLLGDSPGPWRRLGGRPLSRELHVPFIMPDTAFVTANGESVAAVLAHQAKRKTYVGLKGVEGAASRDDQTHGRNRSVSEYVPDPMAIPKRQTTVSGSHPRAEGGLDGAEERLRREPNLGAARGLVPSHKPPTPPPSESSHSNDGSTSQSRQPKTEYFEAYGRHDKKLRRWRAIKQLGEGTFSRVMLATSQIHTEEGETRTTPHGSEPDLKTLVAVKVCEYGPRGGASEDRIEMSLKRELEIMQTLHHPSLVHLKAWNIEQSRALLVLSYCPGGDLFDLAARHKELLTPPLLRRIFAELVGAVRYLHDRRIVHRDIKLESRCKRLALFLK